MVTFPSSAHCDTKDTVREVSLCANKAYRQPQSVLPWSWLWLSGARPRCIEAFQIEGHNGVLNSTVSAEILKNYINPKKNCIWLRDNWDMLIENTRWPMTAFHKASHTHPDTYLRRPLGNRCCTRGKAPIHREKSSITHSCPKTLCWPLPPKISATFHTNIRVKKGRKRNYRKHNFSNKEFYSSETGKLRCPASMDSCP